MGKAIGYLAAMAFAVCSAVGLLTMAQCSERSRVDDELPDPHTAKFLRSDKIHTTQSEDGERIHVWYVDRTKGGEMEITHLGSERVKGAVNDDD